MCRVRAERARHVVLHPTLVRKASGIVCERSHSIPRVALGSAAPYCVSFLFCVVIVFRTDVLTASKAYTSTDALHDGSGIRSGGPKPLVAVNSTHCFQWTIPW
jgi:hypothetical protein